MILYLDTSALVKLFIEEEGREFVLDRLDVAQSAATCVIAYTECRAAIARRQRAGDLSHDRSVELVAQLHQVWPMIRKRHVSDDLARLAGLLAEELALRGYDAVHLATALTFAEEFDDLEFLSFDNRLIDAAREASLKVYGDNHDSPVHRER